MATTVHEPPKIDPHRLPDGHSTIQGDSGNGGWRNLVPADGDARLVQEYSPPPSSTGIWVVLFAITMMFAAFTSALFVRKGSSLDWRHFTLPSILYFNTVMLFASSVTLELSRRRVAASVGSLRTQAEAAGRWLYVTLSLGLLFVAGQYIAWLQLRSEGLFLSTNPSSSFFYVLTAAHALHVLGGLAGLIYVIDKLRKSVLRRSTLDAAARYWHFMDVLWLYLLLLLWMKL
jgi:cytochrome c oxidase subunit 3